MDISRKNTSGENDKEPLGPIEKIIWDKISAELAPIFLKITNESYMHNVPSGSESHFRVLVVSSRFEGLTRLERQQLVFSILNIEMKSQIHALAQNTFTPQEWQTKKDNFIAESPKCHKAKSQI